MWYVYIYICDISDFVKRLTLAIYLQDMEGILNVQHNGLVIEIQKLFETHVQLAVDTAAMCFDNQKVFPRIT
jgi:hypothetical protein